MTDAASRQRRLVLIIGTRKGLFLATADLDRHAWRLAGPHLPGYEINHAIFDHRESATVYAAARHPVWGAHIHRSRDGGTSWEVLPAAPHFEGAEGLQAIWYLAHGGAQQMGTLYAGIEPAGLFVSHDGGQSWQGVRGLNQHPTRATWQPAKGGLALHSIQVDPRDRRRLYAAISAGGVYRSDDGGESWTPVNQGVRADYLPNPRPETGHCVHRLLLHPAKAGRLYQQSHTGTYRSDDAGESWLEITAGLPTDFGYAIDVDPRDADTVYVIPEDSSHMRTTVGGAITVYRSQDGGISWTPLTQGLPRENAYVTVLREAITTDGLDPCGIYFGTSSGHLFASRDGGTRWRAIAEFLPRILSIRAGVLES